MSFLAWLFGKQSENASNSIQVAQSALHVDDLYMLPHHLQEINRLDFQHYMLRTAFQANYLAPISNPNTILDVACGTGRWMLDVAQDFPSASITGIDLAPPDPATSKISFPGSCQFLQGNIIKGLPFNDQSFDFVHQRFLVLALPLQHWEADIRELVRVTRSGGWLELVEADLEFHNQGSAGTRLYSWIEQASQQRGIDVTIGRQIEAFARTAGLTHVSEHKVEIPMGNWGGRIGSMLATDFSTAVIAIKPLVTSTLKINSQEYDYTLQSWLQECEQLHATYDFTIVYGQRG